MPHTPGPVRRLDVRIDLDDVDHADYPNVTVLIDGHNLLAGPRPEFQGFDPDDVLGADPPLLPDAPWRRVAIYRCGCGIAGCGVVAPLIVRRADGHILWTDFRDYTGVFDGPTVDHDPDGGTPLDLPEMLFDAEQYETEVRRAAADRSWDSDRRITGRLLKAELQQHPETFAAAGYRLEFVSPLLDEERVWTVSLAGRDGDGEYRQRLLELTTRPDSPAEQARAMATALRVTAPADWPTRFPSRWDHLSG